MVEPGDFEVIPTLRIRKRRVAGPDGEALDARAAEALRALAAKGMVCVVDLDGLQRNKADLDTLRKASDRGNVWADAGSRFATDAMDLLVAGAERATLRWSRLAREDELREAAEMSDALYLGAEFEEGAFVRNPLLEGDEHRVMALARELGLGMVVIDAARQGQAAGIDRTLALRFRSTGIARWFSGGARRGDTEDLKSMGYQGCFVEDAP